MRKQGEQVDPCGHLSCDFVVYILGAITVIIRMIQYRMALIYNNLNLQAHLTKFDVHYMINSK